jgi:pimeloyl-[acyl-carrier protein] methyl ester esterase
MSLGLYFDEYPSTQVENAAATPLVLLHGWGMHSLVWDAIMPGLLATRPVVVIDLPGMGRSPLPGGDFTLDFLVDQVLRVAPPRALWLGWSLGGMVAARLAERFPDRVEALITVATNPCFVAREGWPQAVPLQVLQHFRALYAEDAQGTLIRFLALQCKDSVTMKDDIRFLREIVFHHGLPASKALRCGLEILQDVDLRDTFKQLKTPTLHVLGEHDNLVPLTVIAGAAHLPFLSAPDVFVQRVQAFLAGVVPT